MYFPEEMTFQYFFFATYPGYFLEALPIALAAAYLYWRKHRSMAQTKRELLWSSAFVCYLTGLLRLTLALKMIGNIWYFLFYRLPSGDSIRLFNFEFDFELDFFEHLRSENVFNLLMYLPFGVLYPLARRKDGWGRTLLAGLLLVVGIELLQPIFGRAFDINDVVLDTLGTSLSATLFFLCRRICRKLKPKSADGSRWRMNPKHRTQIGTISPSLYSFFRRIRKKG